MRKSKQAKIFTGINKPRVKESRTGNPMPVWDKPNGNIADPAHPRNCSGNSASGYAKPRASVSDTNLTKLCDNKLELG